MSYEFRTPYYAIFTFNSITNLSTRVDANDYNTATALLLLATKEYKACAVYKGYPGDKFLNRIDFNDYYRKFL